MPQQKTREQNIWELLQEYKRKFRPVYMTLIVKDAFLDVMNVEQRDMVFGKSIIEFSEEQWYRFKDRLIKGFEALNFEDFKKFYFKKGSKFEFEVEFSDTVAEFDWWLTTGAVGSTFFEKPGAIMIRDMGDSWILALFTHDNMVKRSYQEEVAAIAGLIADLDKSA